MSKNNIGFSSCFPYGVNEGPCFFDNDCKDNLFCGYRNCHDFNGINDANCCGRNQFKSPNYPNDYSSFNTKHWLITGPVGSIIKLQFHSFLVRLIVES